MSAIEQDIIEVDPDTKEMLKVLVSSTLNSPKTVPLLLLCWALWHILRAKMEIVAGKNVF